MLAIRNGKILTAAAPGAPVPQVIEGGTILVDNGKIAAIGRELQIPAGAEIIDATGKYVTPGIIDAHSHIGIAEDGVGWEGNDGNETTDPVTAECRALDGINPADTAFEEVRRHGVTSAMVAPGSANVIGGSTVALKCYGTIVDEMVIKQPAGMKAALGENPKRVYGTQNKKPTTRMGTAAIMRNAFLAARDYMRKKEAAAGKPDKAVDVNLKHEALIPVLKGEIPLRVHAHRADDIVTAIRVAEEFGIKITLEHCTEGDQIADYLASKKIPVVVGPTMLGRGKIETKDLGFHTPVALAKAGVHVSLTTDHPVMPIQYLRQAAGVCIREGMPEDVALAAITRHAAEHIGIEARVGTLEPGKDADIVVWDGDPFEWLTHCVVTIIDGKVLYRREKGACC
ncbi:MAG: amidohydrolase [Chloroflexota bacterium]